MSSGLVRPRAQLGALPVAQVGAWPARAWHVFKRRREVWAARRQIRDLDERILRDLGITRSQALYGASRPFWDGRMPFEK